MNFREQLELHCKASFAGIWIVSQEQHEVLRDIVEIRSGNDWKVSQWNPAHDMTIDEFVGGMMDQFDGGKRHLVVLSNVEKYVNEFPEAAQAVSDLMIRAKQERGNVAVVSSSSTLPPSLERQFAVINHDLPDEEVIGKILDELVDGNGIEVADRDAVVSAACGMTRGEAEDAFSLSFVTNGTILPSDIWKMKAKQLQKTGCLELYEGDASFDKLCGLDYMKQFCIDTAGKPDAKGVLLLGVPGAGKSEFAKSLGNEIGLPTVSIDFGAMMGSLVGQTEERLRRALQTIERMAPCVLFADEIEKALSGASNSNDSGVSQRMLGTLLTWLNDRPGGIYFVGTCNDMDQLSSVSAGAFTRAERFDKIFYIGLPSKEQRIAMWDLYTDVYDTDWHPEADCDNWTGAEIKSCCRLAALQGISVVAAANDVVPVFKTAEKALDKLEEWSHERAIDANKGGVYMSPKFTESNMMRRAI